MGTLKKGYMFKKNLKAAGVLVIIHLIISILVATTILYFTTWGDTVKIINNGISVALVLLGIYQLIFGNLRIKAYRGRNWAFVFIIMSIINLIIINPYIDINIKFNQNYAGNEDKITEAKNDMINDSEGYTVYKELQNNEIIKLDKEFKNYKSEVRNYYTFYYEDDKSKNTIETIEGIVNDYCIEIEKLFNLEIYDNLNIIILNSIDKAPKNLQESMGFFSKYNNNIYILNESLVEEISNLKDDNILDQNYSLDYKNSVIREYTNYVIKYYCDSIGLNYDDVPRWFINGVIKYTADESTGMVTPSKVITDTKVNLKEENNESAKTVLGIYYKESAVFIKYLVDNYNYESIRNILDSTKAEGDFYKAIESVTEESYDEIINKISTE